ncbi:Ankyrin repeat and KH domain-containing protein mask [Taenia solium]|eukprot:TsM_001084400 transcript=TsM_001084400 gene=TsM_001084400
MEVLLLHGASPFLTDIFYNTALHWAIANCHMDCVVLLLDYGSAMEKTNEELRTPLMQAAFYGHAKIAQYLIYRGAQADQVLNPKDESALTIACERGDIATVKVLLRAGDSRSDRGKELHVALIKAASKGHLEVVKLLLDSKAEVNRCDEDFDPPIFAAISGGNLDILRLLISHRVNIEEWNGEGYTPLMMAVRIGSAAFVAALLDAGADINKLSQREQDTALAIATRLNRMAVQDMILSVLAHGSLS